MSKPLTDKSKARVISDAQLERYIEKRIKVLHLDYETFCEVDITKVGLDVYSDHPSCRVLMATYRIDKGPLRHWQPHLRKMPKELRRALLDPKVLKWAFNAQFERVITRRVLKIRTPRKGWRCSLVLSYMHCFAGRLDQVGAAMGLPQEKQKLQTGKKLIRIFCMPNKVTKNQPHVIRDWNTDPDLWEEFCEYNRQDVVAEEAILKRLSPYPIPVFEWKMYELDQLINDRGIPVDVKFIDNIIWMSARRKKELNGRIEKITGLANGNSVQQLMGWLKENGYKGIDLGANTVKKQLKDIGKPKTVREKRLCRVLKLRQFASLTSTNKAKTAKRYLGRGDCIRYLLQFGGASRTLRWAGRAVQSQNLKRTPKILDAEKDDSKLTFVTNLIRDGNYDFLDLAVPEPMTALSGCMRSMFRCPDGEEFKTADLKSIESAVGAWVTQCKRLLKVFKDGRDPYRDFGREFYHKPEAEITSEERGICKPPALGCFEKDTRVLTNFGWKKIIEIQKSDLVFDGVNFVGHSGVIDQGRRAVVDFNGVGVTPDHLVLCGDDWWKVEDVNLNFRLGRKAIDLGIGLLSNLYEKRKVLCTTAVSATVAGKFSTGLLKVLSWVNQKAASPAPMKKQGHDKTQFTECFLDIDERQSTDLRIGTTQSYLVAEEWENPAIDMGAEVSNVTLKTCTLSSNTASHSTGSIKRVGTSIGSTTTATMKREILGLPSGVQAEEIKKTFVGSSTKASGCVRSNFGKDLPLSTEINLPSPEKYEKVYRQNKSSKIKFSVKARVYDLTNCGPRNRFMVLTDEGPVIAHNCMFRMGKGKELENGKKTGLLGYAENMGVEMSPEQAEKGVNVFRQIYEEIPKHWKAYEYAILKVMRGRGPQTVGPITFERVAPYLLIRLPSGRCIYYHQPKIEKREIVVPGEYVWKVIDGVRKKVKKSYFRNVFTHWGRDNGAGGSNRWVRVESHGGVIMENIIQAIARDVLARALMRVHKAGFRLVGHAHDEAICRGKVGDPILNYKYLCEILARAIKWAKGLPLGAAGWEAPFYRKA